MFSIAIAGAVQDPDWLSDSLVRQLIWLLSQPLFWAVLGVVIGPYLFYRGFRLLQRKRLILDIPRSTVRAAALGAVEVSGKAVGPYALVSPLTQRDCLYYRVAVRGFRQALAAQSTLWWVSDVAWLVFGFNFLRHKSRKRAGEIIDEVCAPLFVDDGTGELMIYPECAEIQLTGYPGNGGERLARILSRLGFAEDDFQAVEEYCILPDDNIFVMGTLCENPWTARRVGDSELSRIGPGFVSLDEADLLRREAFVALNPNLPSGAAQGREFNLYPPTILMRGRNPFVISTRSQREVVAQLAWKSFLFIWGGPVWAVWGLWRILRQPEIWGVLAGAPK